MEVLCWLVVLVLDFFVETPNQAFPKEFGHLGMTVTYGSGFHLGGVSPPKLVLPGYLVVLLLVPSGFALLSYS